MFNFLGCHSSHRLSVLPYNEILVYLFYMILCLLQRCFKVCPVCGVFITKGGKKDLLMLYQSQDWSCKTMARFLRLYTLAVSVQHFFTSLYFCNIWYLSIHGISFFCLYQAMNISVIPILCTHDFQGLYKKRAGLIFTYLFHSSLHNPQFSS